MADNLTKTCFVCRQDLPRSAFGKSTGRPDGLYPYCRKCNSAKRRALKEADPELTQIRIERKRAYDAAYNAARKKHNCERVLARYRADPERTKQRVRDWQKANPEKARANKAAWKARNPEADHEYRTRRYRATKQASPPWLTEEHRAQMAAIYTEAKTRPGGPWHVDHIVPLLGKNVSGLHVPWNLQIIPAAENCRKGNRLSEMEAASV